MDILLIIEDKALLVYNYSNGQFSSYDISAKDLLQKYISDYSIVRAAITISYSDWLTLQKYQLDYEQIGETNGPIVAGIMLQNTCNLNCKYCIAHNGNSYSDTNTIIPNFSDLINQLEQAHVLGVLLSGGEPTLNEQLVPIIHMISQHNFYITLDTNGILMPAPLKQVLASNKKIVPRISLDSHIAAIHNQNRGHYERTMHSIKALIKEGIDVRINTVLHNDNYMCLDDMAKFLIDLGVKKWHIFKLQPHFAPINLHISDYVAETTISQLKSKYSDKISILCKFTRENDGFASFVVDSNLNCFSTNNSNREKVIWGNLREHSLCEIWKSTPPTYQARHIKKYIKHPNNR